MVDSLGRKSQDCFGVKIGKSRSDDGCLMIDALGGDSLVADANHWLHPSVRCRSSVSIVLVKTTVVAPRLGDLFSERPPRTCVPGCQPPSLRDCQAVTVFVVPALAGIVGDGFRLKAVLHTLRDGLPPEGGTTNACDRSPPCRRYYKRCVGFRLKAVLQTLVE